MNVSEIIGDVAGKVFWSPTLGVCEVYTVTKDRMIVYEMVGNRKLELDLDGRDENGELQLLPARGMTWGQYDIKLPSCAYECQENLVGDTNVAVHNLGNLMAVRETWIENEEWDFESVYSIVDCGSHFRIIVDNDRHLFEFPTKAMAQQFICNYYYLLKSIKRYLI